MRKIALSALLFAAISFCAVSFRVSEPEPLKWYSWDEAVALNKIKPKKIVVDVFTDWCSLCKKMDKGTFLDPAVMAYISANFYPVKLNAEQREAIQFNDETFSFLANDNGQGGVHTLAYALLEGQMRYPTLVYLDENYGRIRISPGFKESPDLLKELRFAAEEIYNKTSWDKYKYDGKE
ncbi:MAG: thioredoxin family protein [Saprospiraceae bacterium]